MDRLKYRIIAFHGGIQTDLSDHCITWGSQNGGRLENAFGSVYDDASATVILRLEELPTFPAVLSTILTIETTTPDGVNHRNFTGYVRGLAPAVREDGEAVGVLTAVGALSRLTDFGEGVLTRQSGILRTDQVLTNALDDMGWSSSLRSIEQGIAEIDTLAAYKASLFSRDGSKRRVPFNTLAEFVALAEAGRIYVNNTGSITFENRTLRPARERSARDLPNVPFLLEISSTNFTNRVGASLASSDEAGDRVINIIQGTQDSFVTQGENTNIAVNPELPTTFQIPAQASNLRVEFEVPSYTLDNIATSTVFVQNWNTPVENADYEWGPDGQGTATVKFESTGTKLIFVVNNPTNTSRSITVRRLQGEGFRRGSREEVAERSQASIDLYGEKPYTWPANLLLSAQRSRQHFLELLKIHDGVNDAGNSVDPLRQVDLRIDLGEQDTDRFLDTDISYLVAVTMPEVGIDTRHLFWVEGVSHVLDERGNHVLWLALADGTAFPSYAPPPARPLSTDTRLVSLSVYEADTGNLVSGLSPDFSADTLSYTLEVPHTTESVIVLARAHHPNATTQIIPEDPVALVVGSNAVRVRVTAEDTAITNDYVINITRRVATTPVGSDWSLSNLTLNRVSLDSDLNPVKGPAYALTPVFASGTFHYSVVIPQSTNSIFTGLYVTPTDSDAEYTIRSSHTAHQVVDNGPYFSFIQQADSTATFNVSVTAPDGTQGNYIVIVTRSGSAPAPSSDGSLSAITLSSGVLSPEFSASVRNYTVNVPFTTTQMSVSATKTNPLSSIAVNRASPFILNVGETILYITVLAPDGTPTQYTITFNRASPSETPGDANSAMSSFIVRSFYVDEDSVEDTRVSSTITPAFSSSVFGYTHNMEAMPFYSDAQNFPGAELQAVALSSGARISLNGVVINENSNAVSTSLPIPDPGQSIVHSIVVTAANGVDTSTYTLTIVRPANLEATDDATLRSIVLSNGTLSPVFDSATTSYSVTVPGTTTSLTVIATTTEPGATVAFSTDDTTPQTASPFELAEDHTLNLTIVVTAEDTTTTKSYTIAITRPEITTICTLDSLTLSVGELSPAFNRGVLNYTAELPANTDSVRVTGIPVDDDATITYIGATDGSNSVPIVVGSEVVDIRVTAQDGTTTCTYRITFNRLFEDGLVCTLHNMGTWSSGESGNPPQEITARLRATSDPDTACTSPQRATDVPLAETPFYAYYASFSVSSSYTSGIELTIETQIVETFPGNNTWVGDGIKDTYLYVLSNAGFKGAVLHRNDNDPDRSSLTTSGSEENKLSKIKSRFMPGNYTIVVTTAQPNISGVFKLTVTATPVIATDDDVEALYLKYSGGTATLSYNVNDAGTFRLVSLSAPLSIETDSTIISQINSSINGFAYSVDNTNISNPSEWNFSEADLSGNNGLSSNWTASALGQESRNSQQDPWTTDGWDQLSAKATSIDTSLLTDLTHTLKLSSGFSSQLKVLLLSKSGSTFSLIQPLLTAYSFDYSATDRTTSVSVASPAFEKNKSGGKFNDNSANDMWIVVIKHNIQSFE